MSLLKNMRNMMGVAVVAGVSNFALYMAMRGPRPEKVQVIAHRGGAALEPENTEAAFRNAARIGADWIEFDVHRTSDGVLVIMHDDTVNRMTNGVGFIKDMTWEQLHELRVVNGEFIMTFEEVVTLAQQIGVGILAELKSTGYYPDIEVEALEIVRKAGYSDRTVFTSFDWDALAHIKELAPEMSVSALVGLTQWNAIEQVPENFEIVAPMAEMLLLNPWMIPHAHGAGYEVWAWFGVLDNPVVYRLMLEIGVNGLIVNDPVTALNMVGKKSLPALPPREGTI
jgi:glycerophosphoryl diester phosphodiesterase